MSEEKTREEMKRQNIEDAFIALCCAVFVILNLVML